LFVFSTSIFIFLMFDFSFWPFYKKFIYFQFNPSTLIRYILFFLIQSVLVEF
jgi:hypothetical protein